MAHGVVSGNLQKVKGRKKNIIESYGDDNENLVKDVSGKLLKNRGTLVTLQQGMSISQKICGTGDATLFFNFFF